MALLSMQKGFSTLRQIKQRSVISQKTFFFGLRFAKRLFGKLMLGFSRGRIRFFLDRTVGSKLTLIYQKWNE